MDEFIIEGYLESVHYDPAEALGDAWRHRFRSFRGESEAEVFFDVIWGHQLAPIGTLVKLRMELKSAEAKAEEVQP